MRSIVAPADTRSARRPAGADSSSTSQDGQPAPQETSSARAIDRAIEMVRGGITYAEAERETGVGWDEIRRAACRARSNAVWAKATAEDRKAHGRATREGRAASAAERVARTRAERAVGIFPAQDGQRGPAGDARATQDRQPAAASRTLDPGSRLRESPRAKEKP